MGISDYRNRIFAAYGRVADKTNLGDRFVQLENILVSTWETPEGWLAGTPAEEAVPATILVIDHVDMTRASLRMLLEDDGYRVLGARLASEAMEILEDGRVDLILMDTLLHDGHGVEFCRRLRENRRTELIPVMMLSRTATVEQEVAGFSAGADGYLSRPFHPEVLRTRVRSKLRQKAIVDRLE